MHGSHVYGTNKSTSDVDLIIITKDDQTFENRTFQDDKTYDCAFYTVSEFSDMAQRNHIDVVESLYAPEKYKLKEHVEIPFILDPEKIRRQFSATASNSWSKAFKKLADTEDYNPYIGKKSLFHSLRIYTFGIQLLRDGEIDFSSANHLYEPIMNSDNLKEFQPLRNSLRSEFKAVYNVDHKPMDVYVAETLSGEKFHTKSEKEMIQVQKDIGLNHYHFTDSDHYALSESTLVTPGETVKYRDFVTKNRPLTDEDVTNLDQLDCEWFRINSWYHYC